MDRLSDAAVEQFIAIRRDIHRHPELAFNERRTAALVAAQLGAWGYQVTTGLGGTGVVGQLKRGTSSRSIGLRADMDALPIAEATGAAWASCTHGVMHACGHDGHTAMLLAAAQHLAQQGRFDGTLNLIFQPAEEGGGGALKMMEDGLFERFPCGAIFAMHNMPGYPQGQLVFRSGPTMASSDYATVTLHGQGGHGAMPHRATDVVVAAASLVMALQTVVSRSVDPLQPAVVTVGALHAGKANNVIPAEARWRSACAPSIPEVRSRHGAAHQGTGAAAGRELLRARARSTGARLCGAGQRRPADRPCAARWRSELVPAEQVTLQGRLADRQRRLRLHARARARQLPADRQRRQWRTGRLHGAQPGYDFNDQNIAPGAAYWIALVNELLSPTHP
jgi:hippurate hydrolase